MTCETEECFFTRFFFILGTNLNRNTYINLEQYFKQNPVS